MIKGRVWKRITLGFSGLLFTTLLVAIGAGCGEQVSRRTPAEDLDPFTTDHVATVRLVMSKEAQTECLKNAVAENYVKADFWFDDELVPDVAVRTKGNASLWETLKLGSRRFGLKVDFNLFNRARSFHGLKKVNLNNNWGDPSFIRECLSYELFEYMKIPTPRASFVDLWLNDIHLGLYTMVEHIDKTFLDRHFPKADGNLYKPRIPVALLDWTEAELKEQQAKQGVVKQDDSNTGSDVNLGGGNLGEIVQALGQQELMPTAAPPPTPQLLPPGRRPPPYAPPPDLFPPLPLDYLELMQLRTNENSPDYSALFRLLDVLNNEPDETFPEEIEKVLDVDQVLRFLAVSTLIVHLDNYIGLGQNYYLYEMDGEFTILPWDLGMAFGTFDSGIDRDQLINFYIDEPTSGPIAAYPLVERLLSHPPYLDAYRGYLESLLEEPFVFNRMESRIDEFADLIRPFVAADNLKFYSTADFECCLSQDIKHSRWPTNIIGLKTFVLERSQSVRQQLEGKRPSHGDGSGNGGDLIIFE